MPREKKGGEGMLFSKVFLEWTGSAHPPIRAKIKAKETIAAYAYIYSRSAERIPCGTYLRGGKTITIENTTRASVYHRNSENKRQRHQSSNNRPCTHHYATFRSSAKKVNKILSLVQATRLANFLLLSSSATRQRLKSAVRESLLLLK